MTDRIDPHRPNQLEPETAENNPPGTLEEVAPTAPEDRGPDKPVPTMTRDDLPKEELQELITPI